MRKFIALCLGALLPLAPVSALAAITQTSGTGVGGAITDVAFGPSTSLAMTTTAAINPGSLALCIVQTFGTSPTLGCGDAVGNTWQAAPNGVFRANAGTQIWYSYTTNTIANGATVTATDSSAAGFEAQVLAFSGTNSSPYDVSPVGTSGSGTSATVGASPTLTCPGGGTGCEVCVTGILWNSTGVITPDAAWTNTASNLSTGSNGNGFKIVNATTALSYTGSTSATQAFAGAMACFKASFSFRNRSMSGVGR